MPVDPRRAARPRPRRRPGRRSPACSRWSSGAASRPEEVGRLLPPARRARRCTVGITGAPGPGKSTLTGGLIGVLRAQGERGGGARRRPVVAVLRRRHPRRPGAHEDHALDPGVFIRSMATRGHLGGLAAGHPGGRPGARRGRLPRGCWSRPSASARSRSRWRARPTPRWWWSTRAGATPCRPTRPGCMEIADVFVINKADRPGRRRDPPRPRADARPVRRWATGGRRS